MEKKFITDGIITPNNWGTPYISINHVLTAEAMTGCEWTHENGDFWTADELENQLFKEGEAVEIFQIGNKFYAYTDTQYIECSSPINPPDDGLIEMFGSWEDVDD